MKNEQTTLISPVQDEPISQKVADVFKRIVSMLGFHKADAEVNPKNRKSSVGIQSHLTDQLEGKLNYPMPYEEIIDNVKEMRTAVEILRKKQFSSEKKKQRAQKVLRKQVEKLIHLDPRILKAGFNIKK